MLNRRGLLTGLSALIAAPAVVRATSIMPVRQPLVIARRILPHEGWHARELYLPSDALLDFRREIFRDYVHTGLFLPA